MSGTSLDGIDAALVRITGRGLDLKVELLQSAASRSASLSRLLRPAAAQEPLAAGRFARLALMLGMSHAVLVKKLLAGRRADLIVVHGQTVYHGNGLTWQLINPHPIVQMNGAPVVYDLRGADMGRGGQGAPITPLADHLLYRSEKETRVVLNLGGFINFTWLPPTRRGGEAAIKAIRGGDICPCNNLLDEIARRCFKKPYDKGGARALKGRVADEQALDMLEMMLDFGPRSLGTGDELVNWVRMFKGSMKGGDLARTACAAIATAVATHAGEADRFIVAGGGANNAALMAELRDRLGTIEASDDHGVPGQMREAIAMAVLGALAQDGVPITLPRVTGVKSPGRAGAWVYP